MFPVCCGWLTEKEPWLSLTLQRDRFGPAGLGRQVLWTPNPLGREIVQDSMSKLVVRSHGQSGRER